MGHSFLLFFLVTIVFLVTTYNFRLAALPVSEVRAVAGRRYHASKARDGGWEEQPHVQGVVAVQVQEGLEEPSHVEGQEGQWEGILLIQGKEQQLCFAGAAVRRYLTPKVRETQVRW